MRIRRIILDSQLRFYQALAFLLWSVLPHLSVYRHAHSGGAGHEHAALTPVQVDLANQVAQSLPADAESDFGGAALPATRSGEPGLRLSQDAASHAHFQQEPNLVALGLGELPGAPESAPSTDLSALPFSPDLGFRYQRRARGPPSLPSA